MGAEPAGAGMPAEQAKVMSTDDVVNPALKFVDIHCHLLPELDDGARSWNESLEMARLAVADGIQAIVATPHQLGFYSRNQAGEIRSRTRQLQHLLDQQCIPLRVLPGADVRIEAELTARLARDEVLTLGDHHRHVLLELPHELHFPFDTLLRQLSHLGLVGILSHPERNQGLLRQPELIEGLLARGCLMQITGSSLLGTFGPAPRELAEWMIQRGLVQFVASDAHGARSRRPLLQRAYQRVGELAGTETARRLCDENPRAVMAGRPVAATPQPSTGSRFWSRWWPRRRAA